MSPSAAAAHPPGLERMEASATALMAGHDQGGKRSRSTVAAADSLQPQPAIATKGQKVRLNLRALDTDRPEQYDSWRYFAKAEIVGCGIAVDKATRYVEVVGNQAHTNEVLQEAIDADPELSALDIRLFASVLASLVGNRKGAVEERIRATVPFAKGAQALRCLDGWFHQNQGRRQVAATRELLNLQPSGADGQAMERFFTRYRLLLAQAGADSVGRRARIEILHRAAARNSRLALVWAAWRQVDGEDVDKLLVTLEEAVAEEAFSRATKQGEAAWVALERYDDRPGDMRRCAEQEGLTALAAGASSGRGQAPRAEPRPDVVCWRCGEPGHRRFECKARAGAKQVSQGDVASKLDELITLLRSMQIAPGSERKPKNE